MRQGRYLRRLVVAVVTGGPLSTRPATERSSLREYAPMLVSERVTGHLETYGDPGIYNLAQAFRGLFSEHCEREHGNADTVDSGCPVCTYVYTGRTE